MTAPPRKYVPKTETIYHKVVQVTVLPAMPGSDYDDNPRWPAEPCIWAAPIDCALLDRYRHASHE